MFSSQNTSTFSDWPHGAGAIDFDAIRSDLVAGGTLPYSWYVDPQIFELERQRIFRRTWQFVGFTFDLPNTGDVKPIDVAGIPLVLTRDHDGKIHALINVCRHRGHDIVQESGNKKVLTCPYHGWAYELDGRLRGAARSDLEAGFDKSQYPLQSVRVELFGSLIFVNHDANAQALRSWLGESGDAMERAGVDYDGLRLHRTINIDMHGNWKSYAENTNECYHCPVAHPTITNMYKVGPNDYRHALLRNGLLTEIDVQAKPQANPNATGTRFWPYLWPNHKIYPFSDQVSSGLAIAYWVPISPTHSRLVYHSLFSPETPMEQRDKATDFSVQVLKEDVGLVEGVQRGMNAGLYARGHYMAASEYGLQHISKLAFAALSGDESVFDVS